MAAAPVRFDYLKDPIAIYRQSFAMIDDAIEADIPAHIYPVAVRLVHASGMAGIVDDLAFSENAGTVGAQALAAGATILCDAEMVSAGIIRKRLPANNKVICTLNDPSTATRAKEQATTRSAAALDLWTPHMEGAVVAIGNAPTALFRLLEMIDRGGPRPALVLGFAVGFVGAAESKQALIDHAQALAVPFITLKGRRGGSAMASAAVNALAGGNETKAPGGNETKAPGGNEG
ncbi:MAG: precorrin-8X methylmutase [Rhodospirillaceae bacterium]|nr:precorrin-8X methylmutase [Rhodospirillaceae bacterium]MBL6930774.1 precorrin-8X methylmutase [Rhodospirillales bacterium]MBL6941707.1 precorrin-8X methylmutase [Rhodospirillales bacterium]